MGLRDEHFRREHLWRTIRLALGEAKKEARDAARLGSCAAADCTMHGLNHATPPRKDSSGAELPGALPSDAEPCQQGFGAEELSAAEAMLRKVDAERAERAADGERHAARSNRVAADRTAADRTATDRTAAEHSSWVDRLVADTVAKIEKIDPAAKTDPMNVEATGVTGTDPLGIAPEAGRRGSTAGETPAANTSRLPSRIVGPSASPAPSRRRVSGSVPDRQLPAAESNPQPLKTTRGKGKSFAVAAAAIVTMPKLLLASSAAAAALAFAAGYQRNTVLTLPFDRARATLANASAAVESRQAAQGRVYMDVVESITVLQDLMRSPSDTADHATEVMNELARWGTQRIGLDAVNLSSDSTSPDSRPIPWSSGATTLMTTPFLELIERVQDESQSVMVRKLTITALARRVALGIVDLTAIRQASGPAKLLEVNGKQLSQIHGVLTR